MSPPVVSRCYQIFFLSKVTGVGTHAHTCMHVCISDHKREYYSAITDICELYHKLFTCSRFDRHLFLVQLFCCYKQFCSEYRWASLWGKFSEVEWLGQECDSTFQTVTAINQVVFQRDCTTLHVHDSCMTVPGSIYLCQLSVWAKLCMSLAPKGGKKWRLCVTSVLPQVFSSGAGILKRGCSEIHPFIDPTARTGDCVEEF